MGSVFDTSEINRANDQADTKAAIGAPEGKAKKERVNIALYPASRKKLAEKAAQMNISASSLIEIWISENCQA